MFHVINIKSKVVLFVFLFITIITKAQNVSIAYPNTAWGANQYLGVVKYVHPSHVPGTKDPVIIFMHGNGGAQDYNTASQSAARAAADVLYLGTENGISKYIQTGVDISSRAGGIGANPLEHFVVLTPVQDYDHDSYIVGINANYIRYIKQYIRDSLTDICDTNRIYIVGYSGGMSGAWGFPNESLSNASSIAGLVAIAGVCTSPSTWCNIADADLPVWAVHAQNDGTVGQACTGNSINAINNTCGASLPAIYDNPATGGHNIISTVITVDYTGTQGASTGMNIYEWMLLYSRSGAPPEEVPNGVLLDIKPIDVFDVTGGQKRVDRLFDGDTSLSSNVIQDNLNGYILAQTGGQVIWVVLDSFVNHPRALFYKSIQPGGGGTITIQYFYDYTDTTRHSDVFSAALADGIWKPADTVGSKQYDDSCRLVRIVIGGTVDKLTECQIYANRLAPAASIYPSPGALPSDPGKWLQGYNKVQVDSTMNDAGWRIRWNTNTDYVDTITVPPINGKTLTLNRFSNTSLAISWFPAQRQGLRQHLYLANQRSGHKWPNQTDYSKDIMPGADSVNLNSWEALRNTYYALAGKLGNNPSVDMTGYTVNSTSPGNGLGLIDQIEIGNEWMGRWKGDLGFHRPLVAIIMQTKGAEGAKAADPSIKVIMGAMTAIDTMFLKGMYMEHLLRFQSKVVPWDEIAVNEYATNGGGQHAGPTVGISPEQFNTFNKSVGFNNVVQRMSPGKRTLLTEFGWDTHTGSGYVVPDIPGQTRDQTKSYFELRAIEIAAAAKWSQYYHYTALSGGGGDFSTTGFSDVLFCQQRPVDTLPAYMEQFVDGGKWEANNVFITVPNELYWYMTMRARLIQNYKGWPEVIQNGDSTGIWILKYIHQTREDSVLYSIWYGTVNNSTSNNYSLAIPNVLAAKISHGFVGDKDGTVTNLSIGSGNVTIPQVDESVQYIQALIGTAASNTKDYFLRKRKGKIKFIN